MKSPGLVLVASALVATACSSSSTPAVDMSESFRFLGREDDVRIDAQVLTSQFGPSSNVTLVYEVRNLRSDPIAFIPVEPTIGYESESRTITLGLGAEIPVGPDQPRLVRIESGQSLSFTVGARLAVPLAVSSMRRLQPRYLRVKFHYLEGARDFEPWLEASTPSAADEERLFRKWVDHIAAVVTNALPIRWGSKNASTRLPGASQQAPGGF